jgi:hypothetical protein
LDDLNDPNEEIDEIIKMAHIKKRDPRALAALMHRGDLKMSDICTFGKREQKPSEDTWNVLVIANKESL